MKKLLPVGLVCVVVLTCAAIIPRMHSTRSIDSAYSCTTQPFGGAEALTMKGTVVFYGNRDGSNVSFVGQCTTACATVNFTDDRPLVGTLRTVDSLPKTAVAFSSLLYPDLRAAFHAAEDFPITISSDFSQVTVGERSVYLRDESAPA